MIRSNLNKAGEAASKNAVPFRYLSDVISFRLQAELVRKLYLGRYDAKTSTEQSLKRRLTRLNHSIK